MTAAFITITSDTRPCSASAAPANTLWPARLALNMAMPSTAFTSRCAHHTDLAQNSSTNVQNPQPPPHTCLEHGNAQHRIYQQILGSHPLPRLQQRVPAHQWQGPALSVQASCVWFQARCWAVTRIADFLAASTSRPKGKHSRSGFLRQASHTPAAQTVPTTHCLSCRYCRHLMEACPAAAEASPTPSSPPMGPAMGVAHDTRSAMPAACKGWVGPGREAWHQYRAGLQHAACNPSPEPSKIETKPARSKSSPPAPALPLARLCTPPWRRRLAGGRAPPAGR